MPRPVFVFAAVVIVAMIASRIIKRDSSAVSPTAFYTGHVWVRNGLSDPRLETVEGHVLYNVLLPFMTLSSILGGPTVEQTCLARHEVIDSQLEKLIESGLVTQVVEVAAGLSPRGVRFATRYGSRLKYIEADLPDMVERKKSLIGNSLSDSHRVVVVDAMLTSGPASISGVLSTLNRDEGVAIVTEGLVSYFDPENLQIVWGNFASALKPFPQSYYLANFYMNSKELSQRTDLRAFKTMLSSFVRGQVHQHFTSNENVVSALQRAGFESAEARIPRDWVGCAGDTEGKSVCSPGGDMVNILLASTGPALVH
jgi:O-methyltransferase involved in polyketide biosynthesis